MAISVRQEGMQARPKGGAREECAEVGESGDGEGACSRREGRDQESGLGHNGSMVGKGDDGDDGENGNGGLMKVMGQVKTAKRPRKTNVGKSGRIALIRCLCAGPLGWLSICQRRSVLYDMLARREKAPR